MTFRTGLKGMASKDVDAVEQLILDTLSELADDGFEAEMVEAAVNTIEFSLRENNSGSYPRGLMLFMQALSTWLYDQDPLAPLAFEAPLAAVKQRLADQPAYLQDLIRTYLLDNPHRVTVVMEPDSDYNRRLEEEERARLDAARAQMDEMALQAVVHNTELLKRLQETPDSPELLATLPSLQLSDLDKDVNTIPIEVLPLGNGKVLYHDLFTNGIVYLILGFDMHVLPQELLPYADFFGKALTRLGTETEDYVKLSQRIDRKTGGIYASDFISSQVDKPEATAWLTLQGKATMDQALAMLEIMRDILLTVQLDNRERFLQIVLETKARMEASLVPSGHSYVNSRLRAAFSEAAWANEQLGGVAYLAFVRDLADRVENDWPGVLAALEAVRTHLVRRNGLIANVTLDQANWQEFEPQLRQFVDALPFGDREHAIWSPELPASNEGLSIPAQVNYVGKAANLYELGYEYDGSINVISNLVRTGWLWDKVRAQGGAYGVFCSFGKHTGVWSFLSYRDPNLLGTLDNYDRTVDFLRSHELSDDELTKAIIGAIGSMDAYQLPDAKGYTSMVRYLTGETDERRQQARDGILGTGREDFVRFADVLERANEVGRVVVMGSADALTAANERLKDPLSIEKAL
jgi:Zn-dependent M16 (insulinase) family peptidase